MWEYDGPGWGGWLVMGLLALAFCGTLAVLGIGLWRVGNRDRRDGAGRDEAGAPTPERLLEERFARGEIDEEEFTRRRQLLRSGR